jgi:hypothetical protein
MGVEVFFNIWKGDKFVQFLVRNPEVKKPLWRSRYDDRVLLELILKVKSVRILAVLNWLRIGSSGGLLLMRLRTFLFLKMQ